MHQDLARVHRREEVAAEHRQQQERQRHAQQEAGHERRAVQQRGFQQGVVAGAQPLEALLETALEAHQRIARRRLAMAVAVHVGMRGVRTQQVLGHGRHQRARQQERRDHREHHRLGHRHEQEARHAFEEEHRHEHDADAQQRDEGGRHDLRRAVHDRRLHRLALLQVPVDVLDGHRGIVHQDAHRERQAAQGHDVHRFADRRQRGDRAEDRQRDRDGDDQRRAPAAQEQQDHQAGERRGDHPFARHALDRAAHEQRLVADGNDPQVRRQGVLHRRHALLDAGDDRQRRGRAVLHHRHQHRAIAVDVHDVGLRRRAVADMRHVADEHRGAVDRLHRQVAEFRDVRWRVVELQRVFVLADLLRSHRRDEVLRRQRVGHVLRRQAARLQRRRVDVDLDLAGLAAERVRNRRAGHGGQLRADDVEPEVGQVLLGEPFAGQRQLDDRHRGGVVVEDQRRRGALRQLPQHGLRDGGDLRVGGTDVYGGLEEDLDDAEALDRIGFDVLDVVYGGGEHALERRGDAAGHLVGRQAGVLPHHGDHRDLDVRKDVGGRAQRGERTYDQDQQGQDDEGIRARQCDPDEANHGEAVPCANVASRQILPLDRSWASLRFI
ncbi:hypothetical protein QE400_003904 [Xanthomonas sacchari]|nr:hypothetical protein [Xanthomonas sacchari]